MCVSLELGSWRLSQTVQGFDTPAGASLFETLFDMVQKELLCSPAEALDIVHSRLAGASHSDVSAATLEVDEAVELLERSDQKLLQQEQQDVAREQQSREAFAADYREMRRTLATKCPGRSTNRKKSVLPKTTKRRRPCCPHRPRYGGG